MRNAISPDRQEQAEGTSELSSISKRRGRTCADGIQRERAGEESICNSFLFLVENNVRPDKRQGVHCTDPSS